MKNKDAPVNKKLAAFFGESRTNKIVALSVVLVVIAAGVFWVVSNAAGLFATSNASQGTLSGNAKLVDDASATSGKAVQFNAPVTQTPPPVTGTCPNAKHTPGGPDDMNGCWPYEGNTGVPAKYLSELTDYAGPCTITAAGTVIDKKKVTCDLDIQAKNVTITNSKITGHIKVDDTRCTTASFAVSDSTIFEPDINWRGLIYCSYTATRVDVSGGASMAFCDRCTIQDSYLHSPLEDPVGAANNHAAHNSTVRIANGGAVLKHNTLWCYVFEYQQPDGKDSSGCSANQTGYSHDGVPPYNARIEANLFMPTSGGYCAYGGSTSGALAAVHDIVYVNNVFRRNAFNGQGGPKCGYAGPITSFDQTPEKHNEWTNNRWDDGTLVTP